MDLLALTDKELKVFLEDGIPLRLHRGIYINNPRLAQKLKGFRPNTVPLNFLVQTSMSLIKKEKDNTLIKLFTDFYDDYKKSVKINEDRMASEGYPKAIARSLAIIDGYNDKFLPVFFKLEGIDENEQKKIYDDAKMIELIENVCSKKIEKVLKEKFDGIEEGTIKTIDSIKQEMKNINSSIGSINDDIALFKTINSKTNDKLEGIEKNYVSQTELDESLNSITKKNGKDYKDLMTRMANSDSIIELQSEVKELKRLLKDAMNIHASTNLIVSSVLNKDYETMNDYLNENIGDVIENIVSGDSFDVLREYLVEIIYSNKPVICSTKNISILANIISSIVTGGNYYSICPNDMANDEEIIQKIEAMPNFNGNKVVVIKNKIGVSDCGYLLEYIKSRPFTEKYIFEVAFDKELFFMPSESLDSFHFFIGRLNEGKINYKYSYDFSNDKRKPLTNSDFKNSLEAIGANLSDTSIMNVKFYGLLAFSIIPFVSINSDIEPSKLVNKLLSHSIRQKCEAIIHD